MSRVWQVAAGDSERDYKSLFLDHGLACVGPGDPGDFHQHPDRYAKGETAWRDFMRRFCVDVAADDLLLLKRGATGGRWAVEAVGRVVGPYSYEPRLEDVEGWDLQHTIPVRWRVPPQPVLTTGLTRGTLKGVNHAEVRALAHRLWDKLGDFEREPRPLPPLAGTLSEYELIDGLIDRGVASARAEEIQRTIWRIQRLARWYSRRAGWVSEHEIRTFLIVPLLLALGWPEQRINIEYEHADIALWDRPFSSNDALLGTVIETKRLWAGLDGGPVEQAKRYAARYEHCDQLVVSDGFRYKLLHLDRTTDEWSAVAYANLLKLRSRHPTDEAVAGAGELFLGLLP